MREDYSGARMSAPGAKSPRVTLIIPLPFRGTATSFLRRKTSEIPVLTSRGASSCLVEPTRTAAEKTNDVFGTLSDQEDLEGNARGNLRDGISRRTMTRDARARLDACRALIETYSVMKHGRGFSTSLLIVTSTHYRGEVWSIYGPAEGAGAKLLRLSSLDQRSTNKAFYDRQRNVGRRHNNSSLQISTKDRAHKLTVHTVVLSTV
ncbi:hypothetical protein Bbelb_235840 [Branchiostoma belcheri]|nr:hypothetical protein Bbelb_235840 [Branchiostoma belcheri]